jgi:hypothetical protein
MEECRADRRLKPVIGLQAIRHGLRVPRERPRLHAKRAMKGRANAHARHF